MEIPMAHLEEVSLLTEVDFALAHLVLDGPPEYADFYKQQRKRGRRVILDNSMHELEGKPLTVTEILHAADKINPTVVVPPDWIGKAKETYEAFKQMKDHPRAHAYDIALVIQGDNIEDRMKLFTAAQSKTKTLMLPYREPRSKWFSEFLDATPQHVKWPPYLHLLGVNTLEELLWFRNICEKYQWPMENICVDTAKPLKWAVKHVKLSELENLRGGGLLNHESVLDPADMRTAFFNIAYLRKYM